jgi:hypothetical protein
MWAFDAQNHLAMINDWIIHVSKIFVKSFFIAFDLFKKTFGSMPCDRVCIVRTLLKQPTREWYSKVMRLPITLIIPVISIINNRDLLCRFVILQDKNILPY